MKLHPQTNRTGFSLVELLVATAILFILLLALLSMTNSTILFTRLSQRRMDSAASLRSAMDRMAADLGTTIIRKDLPPLYVASGASDGSDEIYLNAQTEGYEGERGISLVGYRIRDGKLERGAQGTGWSTNQLRFSEAPASNAIKSLNFDVVGEKIFRMKVEFIGTNGLILTGTPTNWSQIQAIVINMAAVDARALQAATGGREELAALLPGTASSPGDGIIGDWKKTLVDPEFLKGDSHFPAQTRQGIEVRRRILPVLK